MASKPIPIGDDSQNGTTQHIVSKGAAESNYLLSKSLDMYRSGGAGFMKDVRQSNRSATISNISHSGYLSRLVSSNCTTTPLLPIQAPVELATVRSYPIGKEYIEDDKKELSTVHSICEPCHTAPSQTEEASLGLDFLAAFCGIDLPPLSQQVETPVITVETPNQSRTQTRSQPIQVAYIPNTSYTSPDSRTGSSATSYISSPVTKTTYEADEDEDGRCWRAKYCVLFGETLYFYQTQDEAESFPAAQERLRAYEDSDSDLSSSPSSPTYNSSMTRADNLWERRVQLESVDTVRSARVGSDSFELILKDGHELVLRAKNAKEMNEWIFQIHCCIESLVRDIMMMKQETADSKPRARIGDIHHPTKSSLDPTYKGSADDSNAVSCLSPTRQNDKLSVNSFGSSFTNSPRYQRMISHANSRPTSLSHGHGRHRRHRRPQPQGDSAGHPQLPFAVLPPEERVRTGVTTAAASSSVPTPLDAGDKARKPMHSSSTTFVPPEVCSLRCEDPETERPPPSKGKYIAPHLRNRSTAKVNEFPPTLQHRTTAYVPPHKRKAMPMPAAPPLNNPYTAVHAEQEQQHNLPRNPAQQEHTKKRSLVALDSVVSDDDDTHESSVKLGGCADDSFVTGSISDPMFIPRTASKLAKVTTHPFGYSSKVDTSIGQLQWEVGAFSECGVRNFNEDAFVVTSNIVDAFSTLDKTCIQPTVWDTFSKLHPPGLFCIFDGHAGDQAARYASEQLIQLIYDESLFGKSDVEGHSVSTCVQQILERAICRLDRDFCDICIENGRDWESGATALVVVLVEKQAVVANLGDARGFAARSVSEADDIDAHRQKGWNEVPLEDCGSSQQCVWKEVTDVHSPSKTTELARIVEANGWVTTETEMPVSQLYRVAFYDDDVFEILTRSESQNSPKASAPCRVLQISRVCGELAVSRSLGDRDFKASYNTSQVTDGEACWSSSHLCLAYPRNHNRSFVGDLVSCKAEFRNIGVGGERVSDEFILLACDGLWDVIDPDDAIRVAHNFLFEKKFSAKKAAGCLADLAVRLGSSDNITIIILRFC